LHAGIDAVIGEIEFVQAPQHFLNIDGIGTTPDGELFLLVVSHVFSLPMIFLQPCIAEDRRKSEGQQGSGQ